MEVTFQRMDVLQELLVRKDVPDNLDLDKWPEIDAMMMNAFLTKNGIHTNEFANYDSYIPDIIKLIKEHIKISFVDEEDNLHRIRVSNCYFIKPYEQKFGIDNPEQALLRNHYEATIRGTIVYTIHTKNTSTEHILEKENEDRHVEMSDDEGDADDDICDNAGCPDSDSMIESSSDDDEDEDEVVHSKQSTYSFSFDHDIYAAYTELTHKTVKDNHHLIDFPVLLWSMLCHMKGPYMISSAYSKPYLKVPTYCVNRNFKICPNEEYFVNNRIILDAIGKVEHRAKFYSIAKKGRTNSTLSFRATPVKFRNPAWEQSVRFTVFVPYEKPKVSLPIIVFAMAFGWSISEFVRCVRMFVGPDIKGEVEPFFEILASDVEGCRTQRDAIRQIGKRLKRCRMMNETDMFSYVAFTLHGEFLPNLIDHDAIGNNADYSLENIRKGYTLAQCVAELIRLHPITNKSRIQHGTEWKPHDKRSYEIKRLDTPGEKMLRLVRKCLKKQTKKGSSKLKMAVENGKRIDFNAILSRKNIKLTNAVKNGIWECKSDAPESSQNKTQMMITGFSSDSNGMQAQKVVKFSMKKNSNIESLLPHPTMIGRLDPYGTPESEKCGAVRYKAVGSVTTGQVDIFQLSKVVARVIEQNAEALGWVDATCKRFPNYTEYTNVFDLFGGLTGWVRRPALLYDIFLRLRRSGLLYKYFGMEYQKSKHCFYFCCDEGRQVRPLFILSQLKRTIELVNGPIFSVLTDPVSYMIEQGLVEYLDAAEEFCGLVLTADCIETALKNDFEQTHMEIHGCLSMTPTVAKAYSTFNQGPRRGKTANMEKRAISLKLNPDRGTTASYSLLYGQVPLQSDPVDKALHLRQDEPVGVHVRLAVQPHSGNMEDSWVIKKEALDRGVGMTIEHPCITVQVGSTMQICRPDRRCRGRASEEKYHTLDKNGFPTVGRILNGGDCLLGIVNKKLGKDGAPRCVSKFTSVNKKPYRVEEVTTLPIGSLQPTVVRITLIAVSNACAGNKFYLRHGQKATVGAIIPSIDMPFIANGPDAGVTPDLMINVFGLMRVTQGLCMEILTSTAMALSPSLMSQYDTIFLSEKSMEKKMRIVTHILRTHGLHYTGREQMICGTTGRPMKARIFTGMVYFHALKHMASDKLRSRDRGPVNELTRQTTVGQKSAGGQKFGEMEGWNLYCFGMAMTLRNMHYEVADKFLIFFCTKCCNNAIGCLDTGFYFCKVCENGDNLVRLYVPYTTSLLFKELGCAGWGHTFIARKKQNHAEGADEDQIFDKYKRLKI